MTLIFALALTVAGPVLPDVIFLKAGQRLEGEVTLKDSVYEIRNEFGTWTLPQGEVAKVVPSIEAIQAGIQQLHAKARALYEEGLTLQDNNPKAANVRIKEGIAILQQISDRYNEAIETYPDNKNGDLPRDLVRIRQELRLYRDQLSSERAAPSPPTEPKVVEPEPPAPPPPPPALPQKPSFDVAAVTAQAEAGDIDAQVAIGMHLDDTDHNLTGAVSWYKRAAAKNHPRAQVRLGRLHLLGRGLKQDYTEARKHFKQADVQGNALGAFYLGRMDAEGRGAPRNPDTADAQCQKAADALQQEAANADGESLCALGWMLREGFGVEQDIQKALDCYQAAIDTGYAEASNELGSAYRTGRGVSKNMDDARKYYRLAAERGLADAQVNLGELFDDYEGAPCPANKDYASAQDWYRKAADQNHGRALYRLGVLFLDGKGVAKDPAKAADFILKGFATVTDDFLPFLLNDLGYLYDRGLGVKKNSAEGLKCYRQAADLGNASAQYNLGSIALEKKQDKEAYKWFVEAARRGNAKAQNNLATFHATGRGVKKDLQEAEKWYLMAAQQGDPTAAENLKRLQRERDPRRKR